MKKAKIALKPYLEIINGHCNSLSNKELADIIITLAKNVPTVGRVEFLNKFESYLPDHINRSAAKPQSNQTERILSDIEALEESIKERIESIEDGSYWDNPDSWDYDSYYDEEPDYIGDDHTHELDSFFVAAENLFMSENLDDARRIYAALFTMLKEINEYAHISPGLEIDIREARARYCRCVYETSDADKRLDDFTAAMELNVSILYDKNEYDENYPLLQDVVETKTGEMADLVSFLPSWKIVLEQSGIKGRPAVLLLETVNLLEGINGISRLARKWKNNQPQGYLYWLGILKKENDQRNIIKISTEALKALKEGRFRERVAVFMIDAAEKLNDGKHLLTGKRERFFSTRSDQNLINLMEEAIKQDLRDQELGKVISFLESRKSLIDENHKVLFVKTLLMAGQLETALDMTKKEKCVGWSYHSHAGVVFGSVLAVLAGHSEKTITIKTLLKRYANQRSAYSERFWVDDEVGSSFYEEITSGLKQKEFTKSKKTKFLTWAEKIGKSRIDHIVSNKHRRAYERAAQVLGSLAEAYAAIGQKNKAVDILHKYYNEKYKRFRAFRREVKAIVMNSELLNNSGFLL